MNRRSRLEVFVDILKIVASEGEVRRTHLMYKANLAWKVLRGALEYLEQKKIISSEQRSNGVFVTLTEEGYGILRRFSEVEQIFLPEEATPDGVLFSGGTIMRAYH